MLRRNLHPQNWFFVCLFQQVCGQTWGVGWLYICIYIWMSVCFWQMSYILLCSPMKWWLMYYGVAFRSVLIHSSIWEKTYLFLYWGNIYFGQIILKNRVLDEWLLLRCRAEVSVPPELRCPPYEVHLQLCFCGLSLLFQYREIHCCAGRKRFWTRDPVLKDAWAETLHPWDQNVP